MNSSAASDSTPPTAIDSRPMTTSVSISAGSSAMSGWIRLSRKTPAATIAAECRYAETGVGAAIARGSQKCSGTCALFARAETPMNAAPMKTADPGSAAAMISCSWNVPYSWRRKRIPMSMSTALTVVTSSAMRADMRASRR